MSHGSALGWYEARAIAHELGATIATEHVTVEIADAAGRTLARPLLALAPLPGLAVSAMDGWAVSGAGPWRLGAPIVAGDAPSAEPLAFGAARAIATGAPVPPGTRGVLRSEHGDADGGTLRRTGGARDDEPAEGEHVRPAGEEALRGDPLLAAGSILTPPRLGLAAAAGHDAVTVAAVPRADVVLLGSELVRRGVPAPGEVRDALGPQLAPLLRGLGAAATGIRHIADDAGATLAALADAGAPLLVTTGGSAHGPADHVRAALARLGAEIVVDGVLARPGHPLMIARRPDGRLLLCLPGNPLAAVLGLVGIGAAAIDGMLGRPLRELGTATAAVDIPAARGETRLIPCRLGSAGVEPTGHSGSGMLRGLAGADAVLLVPSEGLRAGRTAPLLPLPW